MVVLIRQLKQSIKKISITKKNIKLCNFTSSPVERIAIIGRRYTSMLSTPAAAINPKLIGDKSVFFASKGISGSAGKSEPIGRIS